MENKVKYAVYKITNKINGMIYVGVHNTYNINDSYMGSGTNIKNAIKEEGKENFNKEILYVYDNEQDALDKEAEIVDRDFIARIDTYNIIVGGGKLTTKDCVTVKNTEGKVFMVNKLDPRYLSGELKHIWKGKIPVHLENKVIMINTDDFRWINNELVHVNKDKIVIKDKKGRKFSINKEDERYLSGEFVGHTKGMVTVIDDNGNKSYVSTNDPKYLSGQLKSLLKNKVSVKDKNGNKFQVDKNDPRYLSDEFISLKKGKVLVKDKDGNKFEVNIDDPRYLSGELVSNKKGMVTVKDAEGNKFDVDKNDPRYLSGELVHIWKGKKHTEETKRKMKGQNKSGNNNSCFGKKLMYFENNKKYVKTNEIDEYIKNGWILNKNAKKIV